MTASNFQVDAISYGRTVSENCSIYANCSLLENGETHRDTEIIFKNPYLPYWFNGDYREALNDMSEEEVKRWCKDKPINDRVWLGP